MPPTFLLLSPIRWGWAGICLAQPILPGNRCSLPFLRPRQTLALVGGLIWSARTAQKAANEARTSIHSCHRILLSRHIGHALVIAMKRSELLSRILITAGILLAVGAPLFFWTRTPLIHARMAENGGWTPDVIQAEVGKPLHLTSHLR